MFEVCAFEFPLLSRPFLFGFQAVEGLGFRGVGFRVFMVSKGTDTIVARSDLIMALELVGSR